MNPKIFVLRNSNYLAVKNGRHVMSEWIKNEMKNAVKNIWERLRAVLGLMIPAIKHMSDLMIPALKHAHVSGLLIPGLKHLSDLLILAC